MNKELFEVINLTDKELEAVMALSQDVFKLMSTTFNNDPIELIKFILYRINAESIRLTKLIVLLEEQK